jgi:hypothetical protein
VVVVDALVLGVRRGGEQQQGHGKRSHAASRASASASNGITTTIAGCSKPQAEGGVSRDGDRYAHRIRFSPVRQLNHTKRKLRLIIDNPEVPGDFPGADLWRRSNGGVFYRRR